MNILTLALTLAFFFPSLVFGAVTFDVASSQPGVGVTSLSWSHTVTGTNAVILGGFHGDYGIAIEGGMTFNAVAMTPTLPRRRRMALPMCRYFIDCWAFGLRNPSHCYLCNHFYIRLRLLCDVFCRGQSNYPVGFKRIEHR